MAAKSSAKKGTYASLKPELIVGCRVKLKTTNNDVLEGDIFTCDEVTDTIILSDALTHTTLKKSIRIIAASQVTEVEIVKPSDGSELKQLQPISEDQLLKAEERNLRLRREATARIGVGVTPFAQSVFDALAKTLPCEWDGQNIIVLNDVTIKPPYTSESCKSTNDRALQHVKKVLEGERRKSKTKQPDSSP